MSLVWGGISRRTEVRALACSAGVVTRDSRLIVNALYALTGNRSPL